jgi:hypothetical protein
MAFDMRPGFEKYNTSYFRYPKNRRQRKRYERLLADLMGVTVSELVANRKCSAFRL